MTDPDLNLLPALEALLTTGSVAAAARRLQLSASAMSRALARLRAVTGDPLLVRAGRGLVPTPRAVELSERISPLLQEAQAALRPALVLEVSGLQRTFTVRCREGFVENFGPALVAEVAAQAPGVRLHFLSKQDKDSTWLREGRADLETGVIGRSTGPEIYTRTLFVDRWVAVVRPGHALGGGELTLPGYLAHPHIAVARRPGPVGPVDAALAAQGLARPVHVMVSSFAAALALARATDAIATVPERYTGQLRAGLCSRPLPLALPPLPVALLWHPRQHADSAHRWLRDLVWSVCQDTRQTDGAALADGVALAAPARVTIT